MLLVYTKFQQKLLTACAMYNRVMIPFVLLNFAALSFWIAAFIRLQSLGFDVMRVDMTWIMWNSRRTALIRNIVFHIARMPSL